MTHNAKVPMFPQHLVGTVPAGLEVETKIYGRVANANALKHDLRQSLRQDWVHD